MAERPSSSYRNTFHWPVVIAFALAAIVVLPFAATKPADLPGVTPLLAGGLIVIQLSTAFLLFTGYVEDRRPSLLVLAGAFTFSAAMAVGHLLAFPGALTADTSHGELAAWIFLSWRLGFGLLCGAAVLVEAVAGALQTPDPPKSAVMTVVGAIVTAALMCVAISAIEARLPRLMDGNAWTWWNKIAGALTLAILAGTLIAIHSLLDKKNAIFQWLALSLGALIFAHLISDASGGRYSVGWIIGRICWFASSSVLFLYFMRQFWLQQKMLADARSSLQQRVFDQAAQLQHAESLFGAFMRHLPGLAWIKSSDGHYTYVNEAAEEAFGWSRLQICGKRDTELFPAETAQQFIHNDQTALRAGQGIRVVEALRQPDGTIHHSIVSKFAFPGADGSALLGGMAIDVTDHKAAEEALRNSEQRLRELIEGLSDVVVWEADLQTLAFTFVSEAASRLLGYSRERWLSDPHFWMERLHPEDRERAAAFRRAAVEGENELEYRLVAADGRAVWVRDRVYSNEPGGRRVARGILTDITKWKQADQVLRDSEERFRIMTEYAPIMIWMSDANGACVHLNRMLRAFWDVENESLLGFDWSQLIHPEDAAEVYERVQAALAARASFTTQARYRNAAGDYRILKTEASPRYSPAGEFAGMIGVNVDVTEVVRATQLLRASEERLTIATTAAGLGVFEWDVAADLATFENARMCEIFGHADQERHLSKEEFVQSYLHADEIDAFEKALEAAMLPGHRFNYVCRIRPKGQSNWRWIEAAGNFKHAPDGTPQTLVGVVADITGRKHAEEELVRNSALLRAVSEGTNDMIFVKDRDFRILYANPATRRIVGFDDLVGTTGVEWRGNQKEIEAFLANDQKVIESGELLTAEETFTGADGTRTYLSTKAPMRDAAGHIIGLIGVSRDITGRKEDERHTQMLLREVSHRAKNMLAVAQAIIRQSVRDEDPQRYAEVLAARLGALGASHDLLVKSDWKSVGMRDLVLSQIAHLESFVGKSIFLDGPRLRLTPAAAQTIGMALHELATNAQKHGALASPIGRVEFSWRRVANGSRPRFEMTWSETGGPGRHAPKREGFGYSVITRMVEHALDAEVRFEISEQGVTWQANAPTEEVLTDVVGSGEKLERSDEPAHSHP